MVENAGIQSGSRDQARRQGGRGRSAVSRAEFSSCGRAFHAGVVTNRGGDGVGFAQQ